MDSPLRVSYYLLNLYWFIIPSEFANAVLLLLGWISREQTTRSTTNATTSWVQAYFELFLSKRRKCHVWKREHWSSSCAIPITNLELYGKHRCWESLYDWSNETLIICLTVCNASTTSAGANGRGAYRISPPRLLCLRIDFWGQRATGASSRLCRTVGPI